MLYVLKKEQVEHARLRALAQAIIAKDKGKEAFDEYMKVAFPWIETQKQRDATDHKKLLFDEVKKGGLGITPLWQANKKGQGRTKTVERAPEDPAVANARSKRLSAKLGRTIPV